MKYLLVPSLLISLGVRAVSYSPNDGHSPPGTFSSKAGESLAGESKGGKTKIIKTTTIQKEEIAPKEDKGQRASGSPDKPVLDSDPNDELYRVGPLDTRESDSPVPEEMEALEENALDYSTTPEKRTTKPLAPNKK
jgi:hypothetical protein